MNAATKRIGISTRTWVDVSVLTLLSAIGLFGFASSFSDLSYLVAGFGGLLVGTGAALVATYFRFDALISALVVVVAYFVFGSFFAMPGQAFLGFLPSLETLSGLAIGAIFGWSDIVTLTTPIAAPDYIGVLPYVVTWAIGVISATLAARWFVIRRRTPAKSFVALIGPIAIYVTSVLTGTEIPYLAALRGIGFAVIGLVWMAWRVPVGQQESTDASRALLRRKIVGVGVIALAAIVVGGTVGFTTAPATSSRFVLRDHIEPPFDPLQYPSPLSGFRKYTKDLAKDTLFTVNGVQPDERIRLATMDAYDGTLWNVTGPQVFANGSGSFDLIGTHPQATPLLTKGDPTSITVTIDAYSDVWLPSAGFATTIAFDKSAGLNSTSLRYNAATGIAAVTGGLKKGMTYSVSADTQKIPTDDALKSVAVANVQLPSVSNVPDIVAAKATELAGGKASPIEQLRAIETALHTLGYLSHGDATDQVPSSAGHGADRMKTLLEKTQWIGDEEQYASVFALMARDLGYPARVVMGFKPSSSATGGAVTVTGADVTAWDEVAFEGVGWIPFYPTPDKKNIPQDQTPQPQSQPQPQVRQPPRSDAVQDPLVSAVQLQKADDKKNNAFVIPGWVWTVSAVVGIPLALYFVPLLIIAYLKRRRRERRKNRGPNDRRAAGAWDELVDTYAELGYGAPRKETRLRLAVGFEDQFREELAARQRERTSADNRAKAKVARSEDKASNQSAPASASTRISSALDATIIRAKDVAAWRPGVEDDRAPLPAIPGLREFAVRADEAAFSGGDVADASVVSLWEESLQAEDAARKSVSWFRRQLSKFRIRPKADIADIVARRLDAAQRRGMSPRTN